TWGSTSDARLKKNIDPMESALEKVMALNPVSFRMKSESSSAPRRIGFIAQEVEQISPELVSTGPNGMKGLSYAMFTPLLTKAIQEQQEVIMEHGTHNMEQDLKISNQAQNVDELQTAVNEKLNLVGASLNEQGSMINDQQSQLSSLASQLSNAQTRLLEAENNLATFETATNDTLSAMLDTENMLTERVLSHEEHIKALEDKLATVTICTEGNPCPSSGGLPDNVVTQDTQGNVTLAGIFKSKKVETEGVVAGSYAVKNDSEAPTTGEGTVVSVKVDANNDGWDDETKVDGKSARVTTDAVSETAKIFVTFEGDPGSRYWVEKIRSADGKLTGEFSVNVSDPVKKDIKFSWWILETK
ncbi:MAG: tail fiber domain-containing protein, partial [Patescibacteria group bacterium]|nr:tail fiber domain-containing protein [Patescibacteria group bacterium]